MNIHVVQHDVRTNRPEENLEWIIGELESPESREALLTVFPACTLCGAPLFASAGYTDLQKRAQAALQELVVRSEHRAFLVGLPAVITTGPVMTPVTVGTILALGVLQLGISYLLYVLASRTCPALACCLLGAVEPLLNPVWVLIFNGERPGVFALAGGIIVIIAITVWCVWDGKQKEVQLCADT